MSRICRLISTALVAALVLSMLVSGASIAEKTKLGWFFVIPHPVGEQCRQGVEKFVEQYGDDFDVTMKIGSESGFAPAATIIEGMVAQGIKLLSIYPPDAVAINGLVEELEMEGVQVGLYGGNCQMPTPTKFLVATDVSECTRLAMDELLKDIDYKGGVMVCYESLSDLNAQIRKQVVEEMVSQYPDVTLLQAVICDSGTVEGSTEKIESAFSGQINEVDAMMSVGYTPTLGMINVIDNYRATGGDRKLVTVGIDIDDIVINAIKNDVLTCTLAQNLEGMGYISMMMLKYISEGYEMADGMYHVDSGTVIVNKDNVDTYKEVLDAKSEEILATLTEKYMVKK